MAQTVRKLPVPVISSGARNLKLLIIQKLKISPFSRNDKFCRFQRACMLKNLAKKKCLMDLQYRDLVIFVQFA